MNILLIGAGGREHAIAWKLNQSKHLNQLYIAPGNAGTSQLGTNVDLPAGNFDEIKSFVLENQINMLVVGPEQPLVDGIHDYFLSDDAIKHIPVIGPTMRAAALEGSKDFAKKFMQKYNIPTAEFRTFSKEQYNDAIAYLEKSPPPYVLKADGLAAGKGVLICENIESAKNELSAMLLDAKFGQAGDKVVIEEFLEGIEISVFVLADGKSYLLLPSAKDYKRIGEGDTGLNTGGMGSISPVPFADDSFMEKVESGIIKPTIEGLISEGIDYKGFIFFGLINCNGEPKVIEYNARMGDPEAESLIPRIQSDLLELFVAVAEGKLSEKDISIDPRYSAAIMLVSGGYPGSYSKGEIITGTENVNNSIIFHAGTKTDGDTLLTSGGRVLAITSLDPSLEGALKISYENAAKIHFDKMYYRSDLGQDLLKLSTD